MNTLSIVNTALAQNSLAGIVEILRTIGNELRSAGVIIWEASPERSTPQTADSDLLFVLAQWFTVPKLHCFYGLSSSTEIGKAVFEKRKLRESIPGQQPKHFVYPFSVDPSLKAYCLAPFTFTDGPRAGLAVYRDRFFTESEAIQVQSAAEVLPSVYHALRNQISLALVSDITKIIHTAEQTATTKALTTQEIKGSIQEICQRVAMTFGCLETSIYLEDSTLEPGVYRIAASTFEAELLKPCYRADPETGMTGWVLSHADALRFFDLQTVKSKEDPAIPLDLLWRDPMNIAEVARMKLGLLPEQSTPPLSYMAAPILIGDRVLGAIRCCVSKRGPYYFANRELSLLKIVAAHLGQFWNNWLTRRRISEENALWRGVVEGVSMTNKQVKLALVKDVPEVAPNIESTAWAALQDLQRRIQTSERATEVQLPKGIPGPQSAANIMRQMLGDQIQLYRDLANTVQDRYRAQSDLRESAKRQNQTYLDLAHQLKTPILSAYRRVNQAVRNQMDGDLRASLIKLRGLCGKARTVSMSVKLFADLAYQPSLTATLSRLRAEDIRKLVIESADDTQAVVDSDRQIRFSVDRKGFEVLTENVVLSDNDLLLQAISNILDNAGKYSRRETIVLIKAGLTRSGLFYISVQNKPCFRPRDPEKWSQREWRSEEAQSVTAEGSGIGLWIVENIMKAHAGALKINPYNQDEMTEVRIELPVRNP